MNLVVSKFLKIITAMDISTFYFTGENNNILLLLPDIVPLTSVLVFFPLV